MKKTATICLLAVLFGTPLFTFAAMYHYIDMRGTIQTISASNPTEALAVAQTRGDAYRSGVKLDDGVLKTGQSFGIVYSYVSTSGEVKNVTAAGPDAAFLLAQDIAPHSGVVVVTSR